MIFGLALIAAAVLICGLIPFIVGWLAARAVDALMRT